MNVSDRVACRTLRSVTNASTNGNSLDRGHIAIIPDGNGRWSTRQGHERGAGHTAGLETLRRVVTMVHGRGARWLTVYGFSTENWGRPPAEVDLIFRLLTEFLCDDAPRFARDGIETRLVGDLDEPRLPAPFLRAAERCARIGVVDPALTLSLAVNYSGLADARQAAVACARNGGAIEDHLWMDMPPPDLLIRTGGERRLSNFMLLNLAYAELFFSDVWWPDFDEVELDRALASFGHRRRTFGLVVETGAG